MSLSGYNGRRGYALILPARNEERFIRHSLESVLAQTVPPSAMVVALNGCMDGTERIVREYCVRFGWMRCLIGGASGPRNFADKARSFGAAYAALSGIPFGFLGNLDADISLPPDYYESLLSEFRKDPKLGLAGGHYFELRGSARDANFEYRANSVSGMAALFRRECLEAIGGMPAIRTGGVDMAMEIRARYLGWKVRSFPAIRYRHHRRLGTAAASLLRAKYREGRRDYCMGYHPLFHFAKCLRRLAEEPYVLGSLARQAAYLIAAFRGRRIALEKPIVRFLRQEQMRLLLAFIPSLPWPAWSDHRGTARCG